VVRPAQELRGEAMRQAARAGSAGRPVLPRPTIADRTNCTGSIEL
jgi:hypothetical protein